MTIFCTYCSGDKDTSEYPLPAIDRYDSYRINQIKQAATSVGLEYFILSGLYGLIHASKAIPYYDHQLQPDEVADHTIKVSQQLKGHGIQHIVFFSKPISSDKSLQAYHSCLSKACLGMNVQLSIVEIQLEERR